MNLEKIRHHLKLIEKFEGLNIDLSSSLKKTKDKDLKKKLKSKIKYNELMIKHSENMLSLYKDSSFEVEFNHNYE